MTAALTLAFFAALGYAIYLDNRRDPPSFV